MPVERDFNMEYPPVINIENFTNWLASKPEDEFVGIKASCGKCPIAQYLNEVFPLRDFNWWIVNGEQYYPFAQSDCNCFMLPEWAKEFVSQIDNLENKTNKVTAKEALDVALLLNV